MASEASNQETMETTTDAPKTHFNALSKRAGPTNHLKFLRGSQKEILLLTDEYMSPTLHNSSDAYQRHLRSQLQHGTELFQAMHDRQYLDRQRERKAFILFTKHLEAYTQPFLHGFHSQTRKDAADIKLYGETKTEYTKRKWETKEEVGMARLGWGPEDWEKIKKAVMEEDMRIEQRQSSDSAETVDTDSSSVFDTEEKIDSDVDSDEEGYPNVSIESEEWGLISSPSPLLSSFCYRPGHDDFESESPDSNEEDWGHSSPNSPSLLISIIFDNDNGSVIEDTLSPAYQRKAKFLADLLAVREQVEEDIEEDWQFKVWSKEERTKGITKEASDHSCDLVVLLRREALAGEAEYLGGL